MVTFLHFLYFLYMLHLIVHCETFLSETVGGVYFWHTQDF